MTTHGFAGAGSRSVGAASVLAVLLLLAGCVAKESMRPASGTPAHFLVGQPDGGAAVEPVNDGLCRSPMIDPSDGSRLVLDRAVGGYGDYLVPEGRYGVGKGEVLRIECATGRPVGITTRRDE